jgi:hypothetical protein
MWTIAAKVEPNRSGPSVRKLRLYALEGQPVSHLMPISCPVDERHAGRYYLLEVAMSALSASRAGSPYMTRKHTQKMKLVSKAAALIHVSTNFPSPAQRPAGQSAAISRRNRGMNA